MIDKLLSVLSLPIAATFFGVWQDSLYAGLFAFAVLLMFYQLLSNRE